MDDLTVNQLGGGKTKKACLLFKVCFWTCFFLHYCYPAILDDMLFHTVFLSLFFCSTVFFLTPPSISLSLEFQVSTSSTKSNKCTPLGLWRVSSLSNGTNGTNGRFTGDPSTASWKVVTKITNSSGPDVGEWVLGVFRMDGICCNGLESSLACFVIIWYNFHKYVELLKNNDAEWMMFDGFRDVKSQKPVSVSTGQCHVPKGVQLHPASFPLSYCTQFLEA